jgi:hypothetical protein
MSIHNSFPEDTITRKINGHSDENMNQSVLGVYIGTNETALASTKQYLAQCDLVADACHIGFSSWHNFDLMVQRKSARAVLCDFNPETRKFLNATLLYAINSSSRQEFIEKIKIYVKENKFKFTFNVTLDLMPNQEIKHEFHRQGSWLSSDEGFEHIRQMAKNGKISIITQDIRNSETFGEISKVLGDNHITIDTVYTSNIFSYMNSLNDKLSYIITVSNLFKYNTKFISCTKGQLKQKVLDGAVLVKNGVQLYNLWSTLCRFFSEKKNDTPPQEEIDTVDDLSTDCENLET